MTSTFKGQLLVVLSVCFCLNISAQEANDKVHFQLLGADSSLDSAWVCNAVNSYALLDVYRFKEKRRAIPLENSTYSIELFSLEELGKDLSTSKRVALQQPIVTSGNLSFSISPRGKLKLISK